MSYKGAFLHFTNPGKYVGDIRSVTYRSLWERAMMKWCDTCPAIKRWSSETVAVSYYDPVKNRERTYYIDFFLELADGKEILVEVKPAKQAEAPKAPTRRTQKYLYECMTWETNTAKWSAAKMFADMHGMKFEVWTEHHLKKLNILKDFAAGDKAVMRAERRALPNSKYNPANRKRVARKRPVRRS